MIQTLLSSSAKRWSLLTFCFWLRPVFFYLCVPCLLLSLILACFPRTYSSSISPCSHSSHLNNLLYVFTFCPKGLKLLSCHSFDTSLLPVSHPAFQVCAAASLALCPPVSAESGPVSPCTSYMLDGSQLTLFSSKYLLISLSFCTHFFLLGFCLDWLTLVVFPPYSLPSFILLFSPTPQPNFLAYSYLSSCPYFPQSQFLSFFHTFLRFPYSGSCFHRSTSISFQKAVKSISLT